MEQARMKVRRQQALDDGFNLIELLVVIGLISITATLSLMSYRGYHRGQEHRGAVREAVGLLRNAQVKAVSEAQTYQCEFTSTQLKIYRDGVVPPVTSAVRTYTLATNLRFVDVNFTHASGGYPQTTCLFFARGSASAGILNVRRIDNARQFPIRVEQLTARVSYDD